MVSVRDDKEKHGSSQLQGIYHHFLQFSLVLVGKYFVTSLPALPLGGLQNYNHEPSSEKKKKKKPLTSFRKNTQAPTFLQDNPLLNFPPWIHNSLLLSTDTSVPTLPLPQLGARARSVRGDDLISPAAFTNIIRKAAVSTVSTFFSSFGAAAYCAACVLPIPTTRTTAL